MSDCTLRNSTSKPGPQLTSGPTLSPQAQPSTTKDNNNSDGLSLIEVKLHLPNISDVSQVPPSIGGAQGTNAQGTMAPHQPDSDDELSPLTLLLVKTDPDSDSDSKIDANDQSPRNGTTVASPSTSTPHIRDNSEAYIAVYHLLTSIQSHGTMAALHSAHNTRHDANNLNLNDQVRNLQALLISLHALKYYDTFKSMVNALDGSSTALINFIKKDSNLAALNNAIENKHHTSEILSEIKKHLHQSPNAALQKLYDDAYLYESIRPLVCFLSQHDHWFFNTNKDTRIELWDTYCRLTQTQVNALNADFQYQATGWHVLHAAYTMLRNIYNTANQWRLFFVIRFLHSLAFLVDIIGIAALGIAGASGAIGAAALMDFLLVFALGSIFYYLARIALFYVIPWMWRLTQGYKDTDSRYAIWHNDVVWMLGGIATYAIGSVFGATSGAILAIQLILIAVYLFDTVAPLLKARHIRFDADRQKQMLGNNENDTLQHIATFIEQTYLPHHKEENKLKIPIGRRKLMYQDKTILLWFAKTLQCVGIILGGFALFHPVIDVMIAVGIIGLLITTAGFYLKDFTGNGQFWSSMLYALLVTLTFAGAACIIIFAQLPFWLELAAVLATITMTHLALEKTAKWLFNYEVRKRLWAHGNINYKESITRQRTQEEQGHSDDYRSLRRL